MKLKNLTNYSDMEAKTQKNSIIKRLQVWKWNNKNKNIKIKDDKQKNRWRLTNMINLFK